MAYILQVNCVNVKKVLLSYHHLSHQNQTTNPLPQGQQYHLCIQHWAVNPDAMDARYHGEPCLTSSLQNLMSACHELLLLAAAPASRGREAMVQTYLQTMWRYTEVPAEKMSAWLTHLKYTQHVTYSYYILVAKQLCMAWNVTNWTKCAYSAEQQLRVVQMHAGNPAMQDVKDYLVHNVGPFHQLCH